MRLLDYQLVSAMIFAQAESARAVPDWLNLATQMGSFGVLVYLIIFGLPALHKEMKAERNAEREAMMAERKGERDDFARSLEANTSERKVERTDFAANIKFLTEFSYRQIETIRATARDETTAIRAETRADKELAVAERREAQQFWAEQNLAMQRIYSDAIAAFRTAVHEMRDTASLTVNKAQVAIELSKITDKQGGKSA